MANMTERRLVLGDPQQRDAVLRHTPQDWQSQQCRWAFWNKAELIKFWAKGSTCQKSKQHWRTHKHSAIAFLTVHYREQFTESSIINSDIHTSTHTWFLIVRAKKCTRTWNNSKINVNSQNIEMIPGSWAAATYVDFRTTLTTAKITADDDDERTKTLLQHPRTSCRAIVNWKEQTEGSPLSRPTDDEPVFIGGNLKEKYLCLSLTILHKIEEGDCWLVLPSPQKRPRIVCLQGLFAYV